jgi:hypothetical protein
MNNTMGKRPGMTTQEYLVNAALPEATKTYTVIPHGAVISKTKEILLAKGLEIERELYRCNVGASIAQGIYHLKYGNDPDMGMMFAWSNSYDKSMRFKCSIGGYVHSSLSSVIGSNMGSWGRRHVGKADQEMVETVESQIGNADTYFKELVADKEAMKLIPVTEQRRAEIMGRLYLENELLTTEQLCMVKNEFNKPSFDYTGVKDSLWAMYNAIIYSLQRSHPQTWMDQQRMIHWFLCTQFGVGTQTPVMEPAKVTVEKPETDPNQLDLVVEAEKILAEQEPLRYESTEPSNLKVSMVESTHEEVNHLLHGVDNDNIEVNLPVSDESAKEKQEEQEEVLVAENIPIAENDLSWPCLKCGAIQGPTSTWHDGQLCTKCNSEQYE